MCFKLNSNQKFIMNIFVVILSLSLIVSAEFHTNQSAPNITCKKNEESEFPTDLFTKSQRKFGAIIFHMILFAYCFVAIAINCSEYFLPTLSCICEDLNLSDDVAAATFMSIATSAPELFTNVIGTFITESDIGIGHVLGNAYFNMFFVAALGGFASTKDITLNWWPLFRDSTIYFIVVMTLTGVVWDGKVKTYETLILLNMYVLYFLIMFNNEKIKTKLSQTFNITTDPRGDGSNLTRVLNCSNEEGEEMYVIKSNEKTEETEDVTTPYTEEPLDYLTGLDLPTSTRSAEVSSKIWIFLKKVFTLPLQKLMHYTIPDVKKEAIRRYYPVSFIMCVTWIGVSTYLANWMISVIGDTIGVADFIMVMIFLAAGGSVVEAYSVYYKVKRGECSFGLSNSIGCNNLDVTMCLAVPWFIKTLLPRSSVQCENYSSKVILESPSIRYNCLLLVISIPFLFAIFYLNSFKLNVRLGRTSGIMYFVFLVLAISIMNYE